MCQVGYCVEKNIIFDNQNWTIMCLAHAPIIGGVIAAAAAVEEILLHPSDPLYAEFRTMLVVGLGLMVLGITLAVYRAYRIIAKERVVALAAIAVLALISGSWDGVWLLVAVDVVIFAALVAEHLRIESGVD